MKIYPVGGHLRFMQICTMEYFRNISGTFRFVEKSWTCTVAQSFMGQVEIENELDFLDYIFYYAFIHCVNVSSITSMFHPLRQCFTHCVNVSPNASMRNWLRKVIFPQYYRTYYNIYNYLHYMPLTDN